MAEFSSHVPGTVSWAELATTDQKGGVQFYRSLFGWDVNEQPISDSEVYSTFTLRGKEAAAAYTMRPEERQHGAPPHWNLYVTVASVDESVKKAESLGAKALAPPFDVMEFGRMAVVQDPTGAVFQLWEGRQHIGAKILNEPGALCWSELTTRDTKRAESFYTALFGWIPKHAAPSAVMEYTEFHNQGKPGVGMMAMPHNMPPHVPSYWMPYFQVSDVDASADKANGLGAKIMVGPQDIPGTGRFAILTDPQGAMFAIYTAARKSVGLRRRSLTFRVKGGWHLSGEGASHLLRKSASHLCVRPLLVAVLTGVSAGRLGPPLHYPRKYQQPWQFCR